MVKNDGGSAFPRSVWIDGPNDMKAEAFNNGMSLRDYFAGLALASFAGDTRGVVVAVHNEQSMGNNSGMVEREATTCAVAAYVMADAMLKAREQ